MLQAWHAFHGSTCPMFLSISSSAAAIGCAHARAGESGRQEEGDPRGSIESDRIDWPYKAVPSIREVNLTPLLL
jgi:hypothetical protein